MNVQNKLGDAYPPLTPRDSTSSGSIVLTWTIIIPHRGCPELHYFHVAAAQPSTRYHGQLISICKQS